MVERSDAAKYNVMAGTPISKMHSPMTFAKKQESNKKTNESAMKKLITVSIVSVFFISAQLYLLTETSNWLLPVLCSHLYSKSRSMFSYSLFVNIPIIWNNEEPATTKMKNTINHAFLLELSSVFVLLIH